MAARRYVRDKLGRFASKGAGATARGGRLKTASGKKRETQTMKASGGVAGTMKKGKAASRPKVPKEPHVLEIDGKRRAFSDANKATIAYMNHIATGGKGQATLWNSGRVQAKTTPEVMKKRRRSARRTVEEMRQRSYGR